MRGQPLSVFRILTHRLVLSLLDALEYLANKNPDLFSSRDKELGLRFACSYFISQTPGLLLLQAWTSGLVLWF